MGKVYLRTLGPVLAPRTRHVERHRACVCSESTPNRYQCTEPLLHRTASTPNRYTSTPSALGRPVLKPADPTRWTSPRLRCKARIRNVQRFRGGLALKAHRLVYHSTLGSRVVKKKRRRAPALAVIYHRFIRDCTGIAPRTRHVERHRACVSRARIQCYGLLYHSTPG